MYPWIYIHTYRDVVRNRALAEISVFLNVHGRYCGIHTYIRSYMHAYMYTSCMRRVFILQVTFRESIPQMMANLWQVTGPKRAWTLCHLAIIHHPDSFYVCLCVPTFPSLTFSRTVSLLVSFSPPPPFGSFSFSFPCIPFPPSLYNCCRLRKRGFISCFSRKT